MKTQISLDSLNALVTGKHDNPFSILGPHPIDNEHENLMAVRAFQPGKEQMWVIDAKHQSPRPMRKIHPAGVFEAICPREPGKMPEDYMLRSSDTDGHEKTMHDPYAFPQLLSEFDLHLFGEGHHWDIYNKLGAHHRTIGKVTGVNFAVWAPNATAISVVGDFNDWEGRRHPMRRLASSGVWELFIPELPEGTLYKYRVDQGDRQVEKSDPFGFAAELPPRTASKVVNLDKHSWGDTDWMERRAAADQLERPMSVYEVHLGSWQHGEGRENGWLNYRELAHRLVDYCRELGFTHLELLPISEHPFSGSWGYQTVGYYAATSRHGSPEDFMYFVDYCHQHDIGVLIDWVPAHFPRDEHGLRMFDGTAMFEHADPRQGEHPDWGTLIFNYGRCEVSNFLLANALFWLDKYHIDGLRVDAVASMLYLDYSREEGEWMPNKFGGRENLEAIDFVKKFNEECHLQHPGVLTIAEESTAWQGVSRPTYLGGLGFSMKWNMGWMNDTLDYMQHEPIHRQYHHDELTFSLVYAFTENFSLPLSHDEVVHGKGSLIGQMPGDNWQKFANLRLLYSYMWTHPGKKLLFMGGEFGQWKEWNADATLQWDLLQWETHQGLQRLVGDLNRVYQSEPALHEVDFAAEGFEWIDCHNYQDSVLAYIRRAKDPQDYLLVACNFTPVVRQGYRIGVPEDCWYDEILCSDSSHYAGSNVGNGGGLAASDQPAQGREHSISVDLPPLGVCIFKPRR